MIARPDTIREAIRATKDAQDFPSSFLLACVSDFYREPGQTRDQGRDNWRKDTANRLNALRRLLAYAEDIERTRAGQ